MTEKELFDVLAVNMETQQVRILATGKSEDNAEAIITMAVMRRGVTDEFFAMAPAGQHCEGDKWKGV